MNIKRSIMSLIVASVAVAGVAHANSGMTAEQLRAEIARLERVADTIRQALIALGDNPYTVGPTGGTTPTPTPAPTPAPTPGIPRSAGCLPHNIQMSRGGEGSAVRKLQDFLTSEGVYSGPKTGYYGRLTERAVQRWQAQHGVVSSGTPESTGYGVVGPATLRAMHAGCGESFTAETSGYTRPGSHSTSQANVHVERYSLSVDKTSGGAPLQITASAAITGSTCTSYKIDWGDGSAPTAYDSGRSTGCTSLPINLQLKHTYTKRGSFVVRFSTGRGPLRSIKEVGQFTIEVK